MLEWIEAIAAVFAATFGLYALKLSKQANEASRDANNVAQSVRDDARRQAEEDHKLQHERDRRQIASMLQAWWVCSGDENEQGAKKQWGIVVSNSSTGAVFREVQIDVLKRGEPDRLTIKVVPPGQFFCESPYSTKGLWPFPRPITAERDRFIPLMRGENWRVKSILFTDQLNTRWHWTAESGLLNTAAAQR